MSNYFVHEGLAWLPPTVRGHCAELMPLSTEDIAIILDRGFGVTCIEGPFDTRGETQYCLNLHWER